MERTQQEPAKKLKPAKPKNQKEKEVPVKKDDYKYNESNKLPLYGVIIRWDKKEKYTNKDLLNKFESKLIPFRSLSKEADNDVAVKSLPRKPLPYLQRVYPNKAIVMFSNGESANKFVDLHQEDSGGFRVYIPMSFVSTLGVARFGKFNSKFSELQECFSEDYKVLQWRKRRLNDGKTEVTIAIQGSELPDSMNFKGETIPFELYKRKPSYCVRCLRYGHRTNDCMSKPRCGVCLPVKPKLTHRESKCGKIKRNPKIERCLFCGQGHSIGTEGCIEHVQQSEFKMNLVRHKMDYLSVLEKDILPAIRTTAVNSNRIWLD